MAERGFGSMDKDKQRKIASKGGHASHGGHGDSTETKSSRGATRGGSSEQHAKAGRQSHKND